VVDPLVGDLGVLTVEPRGVQGVADPPDVDQVFNCDHELQGVIAGRPQLLRLDVDGEGAAESDDFGLSAASVLGKMDRDGGGEAVVAVVGVSLYRLGDFGDTAVDTEGFDDGGRDRFFSL